MLLNLGGMLLNLGGMLPGRLKAAGRVRTARQVRTARLVRTWPGGVKEADSGRRG
jgi:hypothetical protein